MTFKDCFYIKLRKPSILPSVLYVLISMASAVKPGFQKQRWGHESRLTQVYA